jgi:hypothetical protein
MAQERLGGGLMDAAAIILLASMLCFIAVIVLLF